MKIVFFCIGTRGDIQPSCVLGQELKNRGYQVRIATEERLKYVVDKFDLEFFQIIGDGCESLFAEDDDHRKWMNSLSLEALMKEKKRVDMNTPGRLESFYFAAEGMDLIIPSPLTFTETFSIHEKLNIPFIPLCLLPTLITSSFPHMFFSEKNLFFKFINRYSYRIVENYCLKHESERINLWRSSFLKLGPLPKNMYSIMLKDPNQPILLAINEKLLKTEKRPSDWPDNWATTGFLFPAPQNYSSIPEKVISFLDRGPAPVVFGLGSMPNPNADNVVAMVKNVIRRLGLRCIFLKGWTVMNNAQDEEDIIYVDNIDHGWLFKKCSLVIHHGGVGSTGAALRSGVPSMVTWLYFDQPYWGKRTEELGVGKQLKLTTMTEDILYNAVKEINENSSYAVRAREVAIEINKVDGTKEAADFVEQSIEKILSRSTATTTVNVNELIV